jgi:hypothetical protein
MGDQLSLLHRLTDQAARSADAVVPAVARKRAPKPEIEPEEPPGALSRPAPPAAPGASRAWLVRKRKSLEVRGTGPHGAELVREASHAAARALGPFAPLPRVRTVRGEARALVPVGHPAELSSAERAAHDALAGLVGARPPTSFTGAVAGALSLPHGAQATDVTPYLQEALAAWPTDGVLRAPARARLPIHPFTFWLGTHEPGWLARTNVPLFVSRTRFYERGTQQLARRLPRAVGPWALDSGGFTEVATHHRWRVSGRKYVADVRRLMAEVGGLLWCAPMDWMVEPDVLKGTGLTVAMHQQLTTVSILALRSMAPDIPVVPVLQGWTVEDYLRHLELYARHGMDLAREPLVGVGTMCRRTACPTGIAQILRRLRDAGVARMHAFGVKTEVLEAGSVLQDARQGTFEPLLGETGGGRAWLGGTIVSADSLAWSAAARTHFLDARRRGRPDEAPMIPGHVHGRTNACNNCIEWAMAWRGQVLARAGVTDPPGLFWRPAGAHDDQGIAEALTP